MNHFLAPAALNRPTACALALSVLCLLPTAQFLAPPAHAKTFHWEGDAGNEWNVLGNWQENVAPPNDGTADLFFGTLGGPFPSITPAYSIRSLTWTAGANAFNYDTGPLTLGAGGFTQNAVNPQSFSTAPVNLSAAQTWTLADGAGALTFTNGSTLPASPSPSMRPRPPAAATSSTATLPAAAAA